MDTKIDERQKINEPKYKNLVLSGGNIRGISLVGAVKELVDKKLIDFKNLKSVAGSSAGSMLGILIVLGMTIDEIWDFVYHFDTSKMVNPNPLLFFQKCGIETGQTMHNLFEDIITQKTGTKHMNFKQLYDLTGIRFVVVGTCLTTKEPVYFDYINTPVEKVSVAIRISISIPGYFIPFSIGDKKYIDGGILDNYPIHLFKGNLEETIGIMICHNYDTNYQYPEEYFMAIYNLLIYHFYHKDNEQYNNNTIYVKESCENLPLFQFNIDRETRTKLFNCGISATQEFIEKILGA